MKKISIFLCACAVAAAALMISCKNEPTEYVNLTTTVEEFYYSVSGTVTCTETSGTTSSATTEEEVITYDNANGWFFYQNNETSNLNYTAYDINFADPDAVITKCEKDSSGNVISGTSTKNWGYNSGNITIYKKDGSYYIQKGYEYEWQEISVTGSLGGKQFTISYEDTTDDFRKDLTEAQKQDTSVINKTSIKVELTFTRM